MFRALLLVLIMCFYSHHIFGNAHFSITGKMQDPYIYTGFNSPENDPVKFNLFSLGNDTLPENDTLIILKEPSVQDTTPLNKPNKMGMDSPINYKSRDKGMIDFLEKKAYLYGEAVVEYEQTTLTADYIEIDFNTNGVVAYGLTDSLGNITGKPIFTDQGETFRSDTIRYNFNSKMGLVNDVITDFDGSYLHGRKVKIHENRHNHIIDGKFTTCDLDHPHFYFNISKAIVIPNDKIVSGPVFLVLEDVPTFLGLPFGFFPNSRKATSGIKIPGVGNDNNRGFNLNDAGYYWAISDHVDLTLLGTIYSKGSWAVRALSNYAVRYKFNGYVDIRYNKDIRSYKGLSNYSTQDLFAIRWKFIQDPKALPGMTFSADVNISSTKYDKTNSYNPGNYMQSTKQSSIAFSKIFSNSFNLSVSLGHSQNNTSGDINFTLPNASFSTGRLYPLQRKVKVGETKWYEKISLSYTANLQNNINTNEKSFFDLGPNDIKTGLQHNIPLSTSFKFLKYTTLTPTFNYRERWYIKEMEKHWVDSITDSSLGYVADSSINKFSRLWDYSASLDWKTQIYGTFNYRSGKIKAIRHVFEPSVSLSYNPGFEKYYKEYYKQVKNGNTGLIDTVSASYSIFEGLPYGGPSRYSSGQIRINIGNNLEMKVRSKKDTVTGDKKIKIFESFNISTVYDIFRDSLNWDPLNINGRTKISFLNLDFGLAIDPYALQKNEYGDYVKVNEFVFKVDSLKGKIARLTNARLSVSFSLNSKSDKSRKKSDYENYMYVYGYPDHYVDFDIPWDVTINYDLRYTKTNPISSTTIQTIGVTGNFNLTKKWKIGFSTGYDFESKKLSYTTIDIYRDLHCWEASFHCVPFGDRQSYRFQINVKASMLQDLKLTKNKNWTNS